MDKIASFKDLHAWQQAHILVLLIYKLSTRFPDREKFALTDQIRRSGISVSSNIAEGFSRQGQKEKVQFYHTAKGSLTELENQLLIARDVEYISDEEFKKLEIQLILVGKLITGLIRSIKSRLS